MLRIAAAAALALTCAAHAGAASTPFPSRPLRIVVPYAAGGSSDILARVIGERLREQWGQPVVVENKPSAQGIVGTQLVANATPDGYTLLLRDLGSLTIAPALYPDVALDPLKDLVPVTTVSYSPYMFAVDPRLQARTLPDFVRLAQATPNRMNYTITGNGSLTHLAGILFAQQAGITWTYVPYKGGAQAVNDVIGGQAQVFFNSMLATSPYVKNRMLTLLALSSERRHPEYPDTPTITEFYPGFTIGGWQGVLAPAGTPAVLVETLNAAIVRALDSPPVRERLSALGAEPSGGPSARMAAFLRDEAQRWAGVIRDHHVVAR